MYVVFSLTSIHHNPKLLPIICTKSIVRAVKMARIAQISGHSLFRAGDSIAVFKMEGNIPLSPKEDVKVFSISTDTMNKKIESWLNAIAELEFRAKTKPQPSKVKETKNQA